MNLKNKKLLASIVLHAGKNRIRFDSKRLKEIKEAITKQDIRDLHNDGFIEILPVTGRKKIKGRKRAKGPGKTKKKVSRRKQAYVKITRKLRAYLKELKSQNKISNEIYWATRKKIKMRAFKSKAGLKEHIESLGKTIQEIDAEKKKKKKQLKK